jgi:hypothetical protein
MKNLPRSFKGSVLTAAGIAMVLAVVSFADDKPKPGAYTLTLNDFVPVKDKAKLEAALTKHTKDHLKWKDDAGNLSDIPKPTAMRTSRIMIAEKAQSHELTTIGSSVSHTLNFNSPAGLKAVVDALQ